MGEGGNLPNVQAFLLRSTLSGDLKKEDRLARSRMRRKVYWEEGTEINSPKGSRTMAHSEI